MKSWDELPLILDVKTVREITGLGQNNVYDLFHRADFPAVRVGKCLRVGREAFRNWLEKNA